MSDITQLIFAVIVSMLPIAELRAGLPLAITYAAKAGIPIWLVFIVIILANILAIFLVFLFLDYIHEHLMKLHPYKKVFGFFLKRAQKKADNIERKIGAYGYAALAVFVAMPLPATGAWTGCLIAWLLGLDRKKSILAISLGVLAAGLIVLLATLGVIKVLELG